MVSRKYFYVTRHLWLSWGGGDPSVLIISLGPGTYSILIWGGGLPVGNFHSLFYSQSVIISYF